MAEPEYPIVLGWSRGTKAMMWAPTAAVDLLLIGVMFFALSNSHSGFGTIITTFMIVIAIITAVCIRAVRMRVVIGLDAVTRYGFLFRTRFPRDAVRNVALAKHESIPMLRAQPYWVPVIHTLVGQVGVVQLSGPQEQTGAQAESLRWMLGLPTFTDSRLAQVAREHLAWPGE